MTRLLRPLWLLLASTADANLAPGVKYLKAENRILRDKLPDRITVTARERGRLIKLGSVLGNALGALGAVITIVSYRTFCRWAAGTKDHTEVKKESTRKPGRPRTEEDIRALILKLARDNGWGYTRVLGELKKLGITTVSRTTVANILREGGFDPGPKRGEGRGASSLRGGRRPCGRATSCWCGR